MTRLPVIYIAGKFRGRDAWEVEQHCHEAEARGFQVAALGAVPLIPHNNTRHFDKTLTDDFWLQAALELLYRSDAVLTVHNWRGSTGARAEVAVAQERDMPVFHDLAQLELWLLRRPR